MHESAHHAKRDDQCDTRDSGSDVEMYARPGVCAHKRQLKAVTGVSRIVLMHLIVPHLVPAII